MPFVLRSGAYDQPLHGAVRVMHAPAGSLGLETVLNAARQGRMAGWETYRDTMPSPAWHFLYTNWVLLRLHNPHPDTAFALLRGPGLASQAVYQRHEAGWAEYPVSLYPKRSDSAEVVPFPVYSGVVLRLPPGASDSVLCRIRGYNQPRDLLPRLSDARSFAGLYLKARALKTLASALFSGILIAILLYCLTSYLLYRQPMVLWYVLFCSALLLMTWRDLERTFPYLWLTFQWISWTETKMLFSSALVIGYFGFFRHFVGTDRFGLQGWMRWVAPFCLLMLGADSVLLLLGLTRWSWVLYVVFRSIFVLFSMLLLVRIWRQAWQEPLNRLILTAASALTLGEGFATVLPDHPASELSSYAAMLDALLFTLGIAFRNRELRRERSRLLLENQRMQAGQELALEQQRSAIVLDIHDETGNSLNRIVRIAERPQQVQSAPELLEDIAKEARNANRFLREFIELAAQGPISFADLQARCRQHASGICDHEPVRLQLEFPPSGTPGQLISFRQQWQLMRIFNEALHNAVKHSGAEAVRVRLALEAGVLALEVEDNGRGGAGLRPSGELPGRGMPGMRMRAGWIGADWALESHPGTGTCIRVLLPLGQEAAAG